MQIYRVGGSVRDELLGLPVKDRDWVVVGATPEQMLAAGYRAVGRDFPVFLHPRTHEEYALARTERKVAPGYRGFVVHADPAVTLEEDLRRRDLTINAMARDQDSVLIDPYGGKADLEAGLLRHVSEAFAEDPVRILRVARFAARFPRFSVAPATHGLMQAMVQAGEADALVAERVWQELARGLMAVAPQRMFQVLIDCGALERILPELARRWSNLPRARLLEESAAAGHELALRYASLTLDTPLLQADAASLAQACSDTLKAPSECRDLARLAGPFWGRLARWTSLSAEERLAGLEAIDALRRPERALALARWAGVAGPLLKPDWTGDYAARLVEDLQAVRTVDAGAIAQQAAGKAASGSGASASTAIARAIRAARLAVLCALDDPSPHPARTLEDPLAPRRLTHP